MRVDRARPGMVAVATAVNGDGGFEKDNNLDVCR